MLYGRTVIPMPYLFPRKLQFQNFLTEGGLQALESKRECKAVKQVLKTQEGTREGCFLEEEWKLYDTSIFHISLIRQDPLTPDQSQTMSVDPLGEDRFSIISF